MDRSNFNLLATFVRRAPMLRTTYATELPNRAGTKLPLKLVDPFICKKRSMQPLCSCFVVECCVQRANKERPFAQQTRFHPYPLRRGLTLVRFLLLTSRRSHDESILGKQPLLLERTRLQPTRQQSRVIQFSGARRSCCSRPSYSC